MKKKCTTIRTVKGQFVVFKEGGKYFLEYLQDKGYAFKNIYNL